MKVVSFNYQTELSFSSPASDHRFSLRILPQSDGRQSIQSLSWRIDPVPADAVWRTADGFGNEALSGHIDTPHGYFRFGIEGSAEMSGEPYTPSGLTDGAPSREPLHSQLHALQRPLLRPFLYPAELTRPHRGLVEFYTELERSAPGRKPGTGGGQTETGNQPPPDEEDVVPERIQYFSHAVHGCLRYERGATTNSTTAQKAFDLGAGVCQDYAHILLTLLRLDKIPCRYVAGLASDYGETHAWVEAWTGTQYCGTDPTRDKLIDEGYIALSRGRDFADCSIERGIFKGACRGTQTITVNMEIS